MRELSDSPSAPAQTVTSALELVDAISIRDGQTLSQLARGSGYSINRTFRLLGALEDAGYVARDAFKTYHLGPRLMVLGQRSAKRDPRVAAAAPSLDALSAETNETISLAVRVGRRRSVVDSRASKHPLQLRMDTTDQISLHWGALGLSLLAFAPVDVQRAVLNGTLERYSAQTITDRKTLEQHLELVKTRGFDIALETDSGVFSIAAPILEPTGLATAALAIAGPLTRMNPDLETTYAQLVMRASADVSERLRR